MDDVLAFIFVLIGVIAGYVFGILSKKSKKTSLPDLHTPGATQTDDLSQEPHESPIPNVEPIEPQKGIDTIVGEKQETDVHIPSEQIPSPEKNDRKIDEEQKRQEEAEQKQARIKKFKEKMRKIDEDEIENVISFIQKNRHIFFDSRYKDRLQFVYREYLNEIREKLLLHGYSFELTEVEWMVDEVKSKIEPKKKMSEDD